MTTTEDRMRGYKKVIRDFSHLSFVDCGRGRFKDQFDNPISRGRTDKGVIMGNDRLTRQFLRLKFRSSVFISFNMERILARNCHRGDEVIDWQIYRQAEEMMNGWSVRTVTHANYAMFEYSVAEEGSVLLSRVVLTVVDKKWDEEKENTHICHFNWQV